MPIFFNLISVENCLSNMALKLNISAQKMVDIPKFLNKWGNFGTSVKYTSAATFVILLDR